MKALKILLIGIILALAGSAQSQISVNVNIGTPPVWGPRGYDQVRYYYLPDVEAYYDVQSSMFIYISGHQWIHRTYLPVRYRNYDLYNGYKVVLNDYRGNSPYRYFKDHKVKYKKGYRGVKQYNRGDRKDYDNRSHQINQPHKTVYKSSDKKRSNYNNHDALDKRSASKNSNSNSNKKGSAKSKK